MKVYIVSSSKESILFLTTKRELCDPLLEEPDVELNEWDTDVNPGVKIELMPSKESE